MSFPRRVEAALRYNEQKVERGVADCLGAAGYLREGHAMDYQQKLQVLSQRNELNGRAETKTLHVSLNFSPSEQFSEERLLTIASAYMERIGFGEQPYLVYRHRDAAHPHLHIVSTLIRADGRRIPTHNLGKVESERARREVEQLFGLVAAGSTRREVAPPVQRPLPVVYGRSATRGSVAAVVQYVGVHYRFTTLTAFNAALRCYNVVADGGREESRIRKGGGLVYHVLRPGGEKVGVPLKASDLEGRPTLKWLERRYAENKEKGTATLPVLREKVDSCLGGKCASLEDLEQALKKRDVSLLQHKSPGGRTYGITLVDHGTGCICKGSALGRDYSVQGLLRQLPPAGATQVHPGEARKEGHAGHRGAVRMNLTVPGEKPLHGAVLPPHGTYAPFRGAEYLPAALIRKKKKRRRKPSH